jgi:23S rRNA-/tRNA-specific pseudouridylate synthase
MTAPTPLKVLHEDEALLAVDKPAGLLAVPGKGEARCWSAGPMLAWCTGST